MKTANSTTAKLLGLAIALMAGAGPCAAQWWDSRGKLGEWFEKSSDKKLRLSFEQRERYEDRWGIGFGKDADEGYALLRTRLGLTYTPVSWLKVSAMTQDSRAPGYHSAPSSNRDSLELQEGYVELFGDRKTGFGMMAGRQMLNYGEARLIGSPQWGNVARTWDHARVYYRTAKWTAEALLVSPVKVRIHEFNRPVLGDRIWGMYTVAPEIWRKTQMDVYVLRHEQNRPGGFTGGNRAEGTDRLRVNSYGFRLTGPLAEGFRYSMEGVFQTGKVAAAEHLAGAYFGGVSRKFKVGGRTLDAGGEYKYASGSDNPADRAHSGTFDQMYPANHDKFGHEDLIGWRNIHNIRALATLGVTPRLAANFMYDTYWLASTRDALYNLSGVAVSRSATGTAGRHVGQEADVFLTWKLDGHWTVGAGYAYFFMGEFVRNTTPDVSPRYLYFFHTFAF